MNPILLAIQKGNEEVNFYLENTPVDEFIKDITDLRSESADQTILKKAISELQSLVK